MIFLTSVIYLRINDFTSIINNYLFLRKSFFEERTRGEIAEWQSSLCLTDSKTLAYFFGLLGVTVPSILSLVSIQKTTIALPAGLRLFDIFYDGLIPD